MDERMAVLTPVSGQSETTLTLSLPSLPSFSDLAREFWNLPDLMMGGLSKGTDPLEPNVGDRGGWGGKA